jgi:hypothetical protein
MDTAIRLRRPDERLDIEPDDQHAPAMPADANAPVPQETVHGDR